MSPNASNSSALLRMLEPAVRPVPGGATPAPKAETFEQQSFEALLQGVGGTDQTDSQAKTDQGGTEGKAANPLGQLSGAGGIENESLRQLIAQHQTSARETRG